MAAPQGNSDVNEGVNAIRRLLRIGIWIVAIGFLSLLAFLFFNNRQQRPLVPDASVRGDIEAAKASAAKIDITGLKTALESFKTDVGRYPSTTEGLAALFDRPPNVSGWRGPYLGRPITNDPWDHPYIYSSSGNSFDLHSGGADGISTIRD